MRACTLYTSHSKALSHPTSNSGLDKGVKVIRNVGNYLFTSIFSEKTNTSVCFNVVIWFSLGGGL